MSTYIEERLYYPDGFDPDDQWHQINVILYTLGVYYRGNGKWMVSPGREGHSQLTHTGRELWAPSRMQQMRWCRHDFETACRIAEEQVNLRVRGGKTWAQTLDWIASRKDA